MDFFQSQRKLPKPLSYLLPFSNTFNCTSKTTGWFTKGLKLIEPATLTKCYSGSSIIHWWTSFSRKLCQTVYLTFFHFPERSIALVKRLAGSPKGWNWSNLPTLTVFQGSAFLYTLMDFFQSQTGPSRCYLTFFHFPTFNCTSKTTGWFKGSWNWSTCHANKVLLKVAHAFLYTLMDFFQSHQTVQTVAILPSSIFPNVQLHCKTTGWFTKGLKLIPTLR
jgi:hypothetical protein